MSGAFRKVEEIGNKVNLAVYQYLRTRKREDRGDAYEELVAYCSVACRPHYAPVDDAKTDHSPLQAQK